MPAEESYINERLDHLGLVAGVCQEIGLAAWLDAQDPTHRPQVSVGTATVAMVLNGLGFSNRQWYLVPQCFANKPIEHLLGHGITAEMLNDDCLGRTLDWLYAHDLSKLFVGIASRARKLFGIKAEQIQVDTTSFSVSGVYAGAAPRAKQSGEAEEGAGSDTALIAITYGYSRDHREDLKQWMLALATTQDGDVPLFLHPLDGNSSDKVSLLASINAIHTQLRETDEEASVYIADNGVYSEANMRQFNQAGVKWISRVCETLAEAKGLLAEGSESWQHSEDGRLFWFSRQMSLSQGSERWVVLYSQASVERVRQRMQRQVSKAQSKWEQTCGHLSNRRFACEADARAALQRELKGKPHWLEVESSVKAHPQYGGKAVRAKRPLRPTTSGSW
jgi:transposase